MIEYLENYYILGALRLFRPAGDLGQRGIAWQWWRYGLWAARIKRLMKGKMVSQLVNFELNGRRAQEYHDLEERI